MKKNDTGSRESAMAMVKVDVCGVPIDACRDGETVWVVVRRVCEVLGIASNKQIQRLRRKTWATGTVMVAVADDGRAREVYCLSHKSLPMWLATIEPSRSTSPSLRGLLERFQKEAADVLYRHFFGAQPATTPYNAEQMDRLTVALERIGAGMLAMSDQLDAITARVAALEARMPSDEPTIGNGKAQGYLLDPIHEAAKLKARAFGQGANRKVISSFRFKYESEVRDVVSFPRGANMKMARLPVSRFGDACKAVLKIQGDAAGDAKTSRAQEQLSFDAKVVPLRPRAAGQGASG